MKPAERKFIGWLSQTSSCVPPAGVDRGQVFAAQRLEVERRRSASIVRGVESARRVAAERRRQQAREWRCDAEVVHARMPRQDAARASATPERGMPRRRRAPTVGLDAGAAGDESSSQVASSASDQRADLARGEPAAAAAGDAARERGRGLAGVRRGRRVP